MIHTCNLLTNLIQKLKTLKCLTLVQSWVFLVEKFPYLEVTAGAFSCACILFLSTIGHTIGVLKSPALFQGKEVQATCFNVMWFLLIDIIIFIVILVAFSCVYWRENFCMDSRCEECFAIV